MTGFDVVGFGALNVDKLFKVNRIAEAEEESFIKSHSETCGGSAANTIIGLARLGCKVGFVGKVADDKEGALLLGDFRKECINVAGIVSAQRGESGRVMGFVDAKGERALYIYSGVNDTIAFDEIKTDYVFGAKFLHLTSFVGNLSFKTQKKLLQNLPENVKVSFDPGTLYARKGLAQLEPIIGKSYVMMPNAKELSLITGEADYCRGADFLIGKGVKIVAIKLGCDGCYVTDGHERLRIEAFKVKAVDTTGAGDSRCVTKMGARAGLPYRKDLALLR
jgi:ribokinase